MSVAPFPIDPHLTGLAIAYRNQRLIADEVFRRTPVGKQEFRYNVHAIGEGFSIPDTKVGRKSSPNQVEFAVTETAGFCVDYGLDDIIPSADIANADSRYNPVDHATVRLAELVALDRERRAATLAFDAAQYAAANKVTLSGTSQWSDYTNSNPVTAILGAMDGLLVRPNRIVMGREVYTKMRQHPKVVEAVKSTGAGGVNASGVVASVAIAELLEVEQVLVGEAFLNSAAKGQTPTFARVWGKHCLMFYAEATATPRSGVTYGFTAQWGDKIAGQMPVTENAGIRGGVKVRVGESVKEVISAADCAYLFTNAVA